MKWLNKFIDNCLPVIFGWGFVLITILAVCVPIIALVRLTLWLLGV